MLAILAWVILAVWLLLGLCAFAACILGRRNDREVVCGDSVRVFGFRRRSRPPGSNKAAASELDN